jgi:DNA-binding SARP family transcriptional activator
MLEIRLFGAGSAHNGERALAHFPNRQPYLLLCYLALSRGHDHAREGLASLFWGDYPTTISRKYLRNALWRLRQSLAGIGVTPERCLRTENGTVALTRDAPLTLDTESFERIVTRHQHRSGVALAPRDAAELEHAATLYAGNLLESVYEDWCVYDRERYYLMYLRVLGTLLDYHEKNGTYRKGLEHGARILACDDTHEKVHRQMMRLHYLSGNRNAALAQFRRCEQILRETLHLAPTAETRHLYDQIVHGDVTATVVRPTGLKALSQQELEQAVRRLDEIEAQIQRASQELRAVASLIRSLCAGDADELATE